VVRGCEQCRGAISFSFRPSRPTREAQGVGADGGLSASRWGEAQCPCWRAWRRGSSGLATPRRVTPAKRAARRRRTARYTMAARRVGNALKSERVKAARQLRCLHARLRRVAAQRMDTPIADSVKVVGSGTGNSDQVPGEDDPARMELPRFGRSESERAPPSWSFCHAWVAGRKVSPARNLTSGRTRASRPTVRVRCSVA
jgi:hypothetical protein